MNIKVSVIIPVYNVEKHIGRCIESLKAQTLDGLEFIFVDDCGKDSSIEHVERFAISDSRVRIIRNKQNMGAGASRNAGIEASKGAYLSFIDSDDYISKNFYAALYEKAIKADADVVKCPCLKVDEGAISQVSIQDMQLPKSIKHGIPPYYRFSTDHFSAIYKKELFKNPLARYSTTAYGEDTTFLLRTLYGVKTFVFDDNAKYYYCLHSENVTGIFNLRRCKEEIASLKDKLDFLLSKPQDRYSTIYIRDRLRYYLRNICISIKSDESLKRYSEDYDTQLRACAEAFREQIDRLPTSVLNARFLEEIIIFLRYEEFVPPNPRYLNISNEWRVKAWTDFIICHPEADHDLIRGCAYMFLSSFIPPDFTKIFFNRNTPYMMYLREQFKRFDKKQQRRIMLCLPGCMISYIIKNAKRKFWGITE